MQPMGQAQRKDSEDRWAMLTAQRQNRQAGTTPQATTTSTPSIDRALRGNSAFQGVADLQNELGRKQLFGGQGNNRGTMMTDNPSAHAPTAQAATPAATTTPAKQGVDPAVIQAQRAKVASEAANQTTQRTTPNTGFPGVPSNATRVATTPNGQPIGYAQPATAVANVDQSNRAHNARMLAMSQAGMQPTASYAANTPAAPIPTGNFPTPNVPAPVPAPVPTVQAQNQAPAPGQVPPSADTFNPTPQEQALVSSVPAPVPTPGLPTVPETPAVARSTWAQNIPAPVPPVAAAATFPRPRVSSRNRSRQTRNRREPMSTYAQNKDIAAD